MYLYIYILIDHLAVCITVIISVLVRPIVFNTYRRCMLLLTRDGFLNHCPMKPLVMCQPLSKFEYVHFCCFTYSVFHIIFSINGGTKVLDFWWGDTNEGAIFKEGDQTMIKIWYKCKEVIIN